MVDFEEVWQAYQQRLSSFFIFVLFYVNLRQLELDETLAPEGIREVCWC